MNNTQGSAQSGARSRLNELEQELKDAADGWRHRQRSTGRYIGSFDAQRALGTKNYTELLQLRAFFGETPQQHNQSFST